MSIFIISYDLNKQKDYPRLFAAIEALGEHCHPLDSTWFVISSLESKAIADYLQKHIDRDDEILVAKLIRGTTAGTIRNEAARNWLNTHTL